MIKLIPIEGNMNMEINPYVSVTGTVDQFNAKDHTFTMTPNQYIVLTHSYSVLPIDAHVTFCQLGFKKKMRS